MPRGADGAKPPAVRLLRSSFLESRAAALSQCASNEERRKLALPSRAELEESDPSCFMNVDEVLRGEGRRRMRCNLDLQFHEPI